MCILLCSIILLEWKDPSFPVVWNTNIVGHHIRERHAVMKLKKCAAVPEYLNLMDWRLCFNHLLILKMKEEFNLGFTSIPHEHTVCLSYNSNVYHDIVWILEPFRQLSLKNPSCCRWRSWMEPRKRCWLTQPPRPRSCVTRWQIKSASEIASASPCTLLCSTRYAVYVLGEERYEKIILMTDFKIEMALYKYKFTYHFPFSNRTATIVRILNWTL